MATNFNDYFNSNRISTSQENPRFHFDNESSTGANDGTPLVAEMLNDIYAFFVGLSIDQNIPLSNVEERQNKTALDHAQFWRFMENFIRPIGTVFIQYPTQQEPDDRHPFTVWQNNSTLYAGNFFRVEGGDSNAFGLSFTQDWAIAEHTHSFTGFNIGGQTRVSNQGTPAVFLDPKAYRTAGVVDINGQAIADNVGTEVRPVNRSVRIWRKTGVQF